MPELWIVVLAIFSVVIVILVTSNTIRRWNDLLQSVARRFPGMSADKVGLLGKPRLLWHRKDWEAEITFHAGSKNSAAYTRADLRFAVPTGTLRLKPEGLWSGLKRLFGSEDLQIGDREFDGQFVISAAPPEFARSVLDAGMRRTLLDMERSSGLRMDVMGWMARLIIPICIREEEVLVRHLQRVEKVADGLAASGSAGSVEVATREGSCQVCGSSLEGAVVQCRSCRTPHHRECWLYLGGCSTYACGSKVFQ